MLELHQKGEAHDERRVAKAMRRWGERKLNGTEIKSVLLALPETSYEMSVATLYLQQKLSLHWLYLHRSLALHVAQHVKKRINVTSYMLLIRDGFPGIHVT